MSDHRNVHDLRYKKLFTHPAFVVELLETFVKEDFINNLDFSTIEQINKSFVTSDYTERESDIIYKIKLKDEREVFIYLLLEFQSGVDKYMALRILRYICELYEFIRIEWGDSKFRKLPAVLPILLYNGEETWTAATSMSEIIEPSLPEYLIPELNYIKIAENEYSETELLEIRNAISGLFLTENLTLDQFPDRLDDIFKLLAYEAPDVTEHFFKWLLDFFKTNSIVTEEIKVKIDNMKESNQMLAASIERTREKWTSEGRVETAQSDVIEVLEVKFGAVPYPIKEKILYCDDLEKLKQAHRNAILLDDINKFKI